MTTVWKDANDTEWVCEITLGTARKLRDERDIDLLDDNTLKNLADDPYLVVDLLVASHARQCKERNVSPEQFADLCIASESVAIAATDAFNAALANFLRGMRQGPKADLVEMAAEAVKESEAEARKKIQQKGPTIIRDAVNKATAELDKAISKATS